MTDYDGVFGISWSPDGQQLAFVANRGSGNDIYLIDVTGGEPVALTSDGANDRFPSWSPDGSRIAFESNRSLDFEIWTMAADSSGRRRASSPQILILRDCLEARMPYSMQLMFLSTLRRPPSVASSNFMRPVPPPTDGCLTSQTPFSSSSSPRSHRQLLSVRPFAWAQRQGTSASTKVQLVDRTALLEV